MEAGSTPPAPQQSSRRGLVWGLIVAVVVLVIAGVAAVFLLWPSEEERVTVPDVVGLSTESAERVLEAAGLALGEVAGVSVEAESAEVETVISQAPSAGSEVDAGSRVALVIAEAPDEEDEADEQEMPPARSGGGSEAGGSSGSGTDAGKGAKKAWHTVDAASGIQDNTDFDGALFTLSEATPLELTVTVSSSPAGGGVRFILVDRKVGAPIHSGTALDVEMVGTTTPETQVFEPMTMPAGRYQMHVTRVALPPMIMAWSYTLREWR
jgi:hypothetical protein